MSISLVGTAGAAATSVTLPAHVAGDIILIFAYKSSASTAPTLPAGFTSINTGAANTNGHTLGYKIAASSSETSGTWTNAEAAVAAVYRGASGVGGQAVATNVADPAAFPALTMTNSSGSSWVAGFIGTRSVSSTVSNAPAGMTNRTSGLTSGSGAYGASDTNGGVSSWAGANMTLTPSGNRYRIAVVELISAGRTGTMAVTQATTQTPSASGKVAVRGTSAITQSTTQTPSASGKVAVRGTIVLTQVATQAFAASGTIAVRGTIALTQTAGQVLAAAGAVAVRGAAAITQVASQVLAAAGATAVRGVAALTQNTTQTLAGSGAVAVQGTSAADQTTSQTLAATGVVAIRGALAVVQALVQTMLGGSSPTIHGAINVAQSIVQTLSGAGKVPIRGAMDVMQEITQTAGTSVVTVPVHTVIAHTRVTQIRARTRPPIVAARVRQPVTIGAT